MRSMESRRNSPGVQVQWGVLATKSQQHVGAPATV